MLRVFCQGLSEIELSLYHPLLCRQGSLEFRTDNLSTLTVLKDVLSKEATEENIAVKINYGMAKTTECRCNTVIVLVEHWFHSHFTELNQDSVPHMITLVYPLLEQQLMLAKNVQLIDALQVSRATTGSVTLTGFVSVRVSHGTLICW